MSAPLLPTPAPPLPLPAPLSSPSCDNDNDDDDDDEEEEEEEEEEEDPSGSRVLVLAQDDSTCRELRQFLTNGSQVVLLEAFVHFIQNVRERDQRLSSSSSS